MHIVFNPQYNFAHVPSKTSPGWLWNSLGYSCFKMSLSLSHMISKNLELEFRSIRQSLQLMDTKPANFHPRQVMTVRVGPTKSYCGLGLQQVLCVLLKVKCRAPHGLNTVSPYLVPTALALSLSSLPSQLPPP